MCLHLVDISIILNIFLFENNMLFYNMNYRKWGQIKLLDW